MSRVNLGVDGPSPETLRVKERLLRIQPEQQVCPRSVPGKPGHEGQSGSGAGVDSPLPPPAPSVSVGRGSTAPRPLLCSFDRGLPTSRSELLSLDHLD